MSRADKTIANIYNPLNQDRETLLKNFVIRIREFEKIFRDIKTSELGQTSQNVLIQGQRGSGKTTLLAKLKYEIENSQDLSHVLPVQFAEEQYNIFSLNRLWENVADIIEEKEGFENIVDDMEKWDDDDDYYSLLKTYLYKNKKKLVLLIDNFGDMLDKMGEKDHKKLRDILHESDLQIIAGSTRTLEAAYRHDKPFFESFKTIYLESLSKEDVRILLENLIRQYDDKKALDIIKNQPGRIETIRRLTGGVPRTLILLYEIIIDDSANVFEDLEGILDKITPLYKHKMDDLSTQQQVIIDAIALHWDGMLTSEISVQTRIEAKKIAAQLKTLEKNGFVFSTFVNNKNKLYMLEERFFNIWYLMRYGRKKKKQQIVWLVSFLRDWCTQDELCEKAKNHIALAKCGKLHHRGGYYMAEALAQTITNPELCYEVLSNTKSYLSKSKPEYADSLSDTHSLVLDIAYKAYMEKDFKKAEEYWLKAIENNQAAAMNNLAVLYATKYKDFKKAAQYYLMAIDNNQTEAMNNLALLYANEYKDFKKAEEYYLMAIKNKQVAAMYNLALLYEQDLKDFKKAELYYSMAIENDFNNHMDFLINTNFADVEIKNAFLNILTKYHNESNYISSFAQAIFMIHVGKYKESIEYFNVFMRLTKDANNFQKHMTEYVIFLIPKKQYHLAMGLFQEEAYQLQDKIKPVYYALMHLMKDEYPKEYIRMGAELKETVSEILERIHAMESVSA